MIHSVADKAIGGKTVVGLLEENGAIRLLAC